MSVTDIGFAIDREGDALRVDPEGDVLAVGPYDAADVRPPAPPQYGPDDYLSALQGLMPRGRVWPRGPGAIQTLVLAALAMTAVRVSQAAGALISACFPATATDMLPEWEAALGLPDPCEGPAATLQAAQAQVVAQLVNTGGQSVPYFVGLAKLLGYDITITEFTGARAFEWQVNCPSVVRFYFDAGQSTAGEPLVSGGATVLECVLNRLKPDHTTITYNYGG
jgi:uncharacterized protein YmfQ (DUF2313 family)